MSLTSFLCVLAVLALSVPAVTADFQCMHESNKPGYRCTRFQVTNHANVPLTYVSSSLKHGEWAQHAPSSIAPGITGAWEANSDCPLLDCFFGASPSVVLNVGGSHVTFYGENNIDKLLYGCNQATLSPIPDAYEMVVEGEQFSGCYCCHTAPCDCNSFQNANRYAVSVSIAPVPIITSIAPPMGPSDGVPVRVTGSGFVNTDQLACKFGSTIVSAAYLSATEIVCSAPPLLAPGVTTVPLAVTNLRSKWSPAHSFDYVATNSGAKLFFGSQMMNNVKDAILPVLGAALKNEKVSYFAGSDTVIGITIDYNLTNIVLNDIDFGDVSITTSADGITLKASGFSVVTSMDWYYKDVHTIIHGSGSAVDRVTLDLSASFDVVRSGPPTGGDGVPQLTDVAVSASISKLDISTVPKSAEILIALLKGPLKNGFQTMLQEKLYTALTTTLNTALAGFPTKIPAGKNMDIDIAFLFSPEFSTNGVEFFLHAGALPTKAGATVPFSPPPIPQPSTATQSVQAILSNYLANSALWVLYDSKSISAVITESMLPPEVPIKLNTTAFGSLVPALAKAFPNRLFNLMVNATSAPVVSLTENLPSGAGPGVSLNATMNMTFVIPCPTTTHQFLRASCAPIDAFTVSLGIFTDLNFAIANGFTMPNTSAPALNVTGHMANLEFTVKLLSSNIGQFSTSGLHMLFDLLLRAVALDMINTKLQAGFLVPATVGGMELTNTQLSFAANYAIIDTDIVLSGPTRSEIKVVMEDKP